MNILIVNDDGIEAAGIKILANKLKDEHNVTVIAPATERSAAGHSYSFAGPINFLKTDKEGYEGVTAYTTTGTPCDCVLLGIGNLGKENIDLVISGINAGANIGTDIPASGTVNAALEGVMRGIPSIAVSQEIRKLVSFDDYTAYYEFAAEYTKKFIKEFDISTLTDHIISLDFPCVPKEEIKGMRVCRMGISKNDFFYHAQKDFVGRTHYWVDTVRTPKEYNTIHETDDMWIDEGYIVVTPITSDMTADKELLRLKGILDKDF